MANYAQKAIERVGELFSPVNKSDGTIHEADMDFENELKLSMKDDELITLKKQWEKSWDRHEQILGSRREKALKYWLGDQYAGELEKGFVDNIVFEAVETLLPLASRQNPEPVVMADNTEEGQDLADRVQKMLIYIADIQQLKIKLRTVVRDWMQNFVGVMKISWDFVEDDIVIRRIHPKNLVLDESGIEVCSYQGSYIGEKRKCTANKLAIRFPKKKKYIKKKAQQKMATKLQYMEWWTPEYVFFTIENTVLGKFKNPHWNYSEMETVINKYGQEIEREVKGMNHFKVPRMPYVFLSIFNLGDVPYDQTSLMEQVMPLQDMVNKRAMQIDKNADEMNSGWILSGKSQDELQEFLDAMREGGAASVDDEDVTKAVRREQGVALPSMVQEDLFDKREQLKNIFGVRGSTAQGILNERTVRGKIEISEKDVNRITNITDYLEQFTDDIFNWCIQMIYVYYDEKHVASIIGKENAAEFAELRNTDMDRQVVVSVKEGSMIPQDALTRRNEAIDLWSAGAIDPITLYEKLGSANPKESAERLFQWQQSPQMLFPESTPQPAPQPQAGQPMNTGVPPGMEAQLPPQITNQ